MANHPNRSKITDWPEYVKRFRERHELSQVDLAGKLRVDETTVQRWEAGEWKPAPYPAHMGCGERMSHNGL